MSFTVLHTDPATPARTGVLRTSHGEIRTPVFMPVGTQATVKTLSPEDLTSLGAEVILGNTYHLHIRPGTEIIRRAGGLHRFMAWNRPILTDSGGYQVFSLAKLRRITPEGVHFQSHVDGTPLFLGPREAMRIQHDLGSDIAMAFDECTPYPATREEARSSLDLTLDWARVCLDQPRAVGQLLFGIVQGGMYEDLRQRSAAELVALGFDGYALGGLSVGEPQQDMSRVTRATVPHLPDDRPRYLMGVGTPPQIVEAVAGGVDMFDCVLPTRVGRNGSAYTDHGMIQIKAGRFKEDFSPVDPTCTCTTCRTFTRAYLRHLLNVNEILGLHLMTVHNVHYYLTLMQRLRTAIENDRMAAFHEQFLTNYPLNDTPQKNEDPQCPTAR